MYKSRRNNSRSPDRNMRANYDEPDTSKGDFYCKLCDSRMNCLAMWESHKVGKRHITNMKKAPGEAPSKVKTVRLDDVPLIVDLLEDETEPIVGLDYVCETRRADAGIDPFYNCYLCQATCPKTNIIDHLVSMKHRLLYLKKVDPVTTQMLEDFRLPKSQFEPMLRDHCEEKEMELGRGEMEIKREKSHGMGQGFLDGKMRLKGQSPLYRPPVKPEFQGRWDGPSTSHYSGPSTSSYSEKPLHYGLQPPVMGPLPMNRFDAPVHYGPSTSYDSKPYAPMGPMDIPYVPKVKSEKAKTNDAPSSSSKGRKRSPKSKRYSPEASPPPRSPTPEPEFEFNLMEHKDYLTPHHMRTIVDFVFEDAAENRRAYEREEIKHNILGRCFNLQFAALTKLVYENASPKLKKILKLKNSRLGDAQREQRKVEGFRTPGVTNF